MIAEERATGNSNRARHDERGTHEITMMEATIMKPIRLISTGALLFLLGIVAPTYAQQEQHEQEAKPEKQEQAKPEKQQQTKAAKPEQQAKPRRR